MVVAGPAPTPQQAEAEIRRVLGAALKDPDGQTVRNGPGPRQISWYRGLLNGGGNESAWLWCFQYKAKNSYGAYIRVKREGSRCAFRATPR